MKFADKYEILEMVTSGRVSTFLARERASQEAVVVYTFECAGTGAGDLSTASIISRFCTLAPNPPGIIVKAGFDEVSSSAFITTKMPDAVALKAWVGAYQSFAKPGTNPGVAPAAGGMPLGKSAGAPAEDATAELSAADVRAVLARSGPVPKQPPVENLSEDIGGVTSAFSLDIPAPEPTKPAGEFTRLFNEVNAFQPIQKSKTVPTPPAAPAPGNAPDALFAELLGEKRGAPVPHSTPVPAEPSPGSFTKEFMGLSGDKARASDERQPQRAPLLPEKEPGAFTREFMAVSQQDFQKNNLPSNPAPPVQKVPPVPASASPATSFESVFGPSSGSAPASGAQPEPQRGGTGEFTSFFRDPFEHPGAPQRPVEVPDVTSSTPTKAPVGDFTRMFGREDIARGEPAPAPPSERESAPASGGSFTQMFGPPPGPSSGKEQPGSQLGAATLGTNPNLRPSFLESAGAPPAQTRGAGAQTPPADPFFSRTPPVAPPVNQGGFESTSVGQPFSSRTGSTTDVFRMPGGEAPPVESEPGGPSEFTMFLSRAQVNASLPPEPAAPGVFAPPAAAKPSPFQFTPPPPPPVPAMKLPGARKMPAVPPAPAVAPKAAGFWPLIVVLTVLLAIGGMLVMYFALKH